MYWLFPSLSHALLFFVHLSSCSAHFSPFSYHSFQGRMRFIQFSINSWRLQCGGWPVLLSDFPTPVAKKTSAWLLTREKWKKTDDILLLGIPPEFFLGLNGPLLVGTGSIAGHAGHGANALQPCVWAAANARRGHCKRKPQQLSTRGLGDLLVIYLRFSIDFCLMSIDVLLHSLLAIGHGEDIIQLKCSQNIIA